MCNVRENFVFKFKFQHQILKYRGQVRNDGLHSPHFTIDPKNGPHHLRYISGNKSNSNPQFDLCRTGQFLLKKLKGLTVLSLRKGALLCLTNLSLSYP